MPAITNYQVLEYTPRGDGTNYVRLQFTLDNGETLEDGVRFIPSNTDLGALATVIGPQLLEAAAQAEIQAML